MHYLVFSLSVLKNVRKCMDGHSNMIVLWGHVLYNIPPLFKKDDGVVSTKHLKYFLLIAEVSHYVMKYLCITQEEELFWNVRFLQGIEQGYGCCGPASLLLPCFNCFIFLPLR